MVFIYKFCEKEIQIQPPREPLELYIGEVQQGMSKLKSNMDPFSLFINLINIIKKTHIIEIKTVMGWRGQKMYFSCHSLKSLSFFSQK